jgi:hypothetical protein
MKLAAKKIPERFVRAMPRGLRLVKKEGRDFLLVESAFCPKGHNLVIDSVRIHDEASIKLKITIRDESGFVYVDSFWGSHAKLFSFIPLLSGADQLFVEAHCPYCGAGLAEEYTCRHRGCGSERSFRILLPGGKNAIHVCARLGCPGHVLDIVDMPPKVVQRVSGINYFGVGGDDVLGSL